MLSDAGNQLGTVLTNLALVLDSVQHELHIHPMNHLGLYLLGKKCNGHHCDWKFCAIL
jgi:hypothetical protein